MSYDRNSLISALHDVNKCNRLGTAQLRALIDTHKTDDNVWGIVGVELTAVFYDLGYSDEHKDLFNGSFRSMLRNALRAYGNFKLKVSYKRTRNYTDGDRELQADDSGSWYWHIEVTITPTVKADADHQKIHDSHEVVGEPVEVTETEKVLNKVLQTAGVDRVEAATVLLGSLTEASAAHVVNQYLETHNLKDLRDIRKLAVHHGTQPGSDVVTDSANLPEPPAAVVNQ